MKLFDVFCIGLFIILVTTFIGFVILAFIKIPYLFLSVVVWFAAWYSIYMFVYGAMLVDDLWSKINDK